MGRGVSCGGGKSSLGYLFGGGETATANKTPKTTNSTPPPPQNASPTPAPAPSPAPASSPSGKQLPAGIHSKPTNNYLRVDGQNCGNFITDRPSTKVHAAPGGGSSLGYLFGGGSGN